MRTEELKQEKNMNIYIRKTKLKLTRSDNQVSFKINKKGVVTSFNNGGHYKTYMGFPPMTPLFTPSYFLNPSQFFKVDGLIDYYIKNCITPSWVGSKGSGAKVVEGTWNNFVKKYKESKAIAGNNGLINRKPRGFVDVRDFVLRYMNKVCLDFGFDTEWYDDDRKVLSYQFSTTLDDI